MYSDYKIIYFVALFLQPCLRTVDLVQSPLQCSASLAGPVVNVVHEENEQSTSFISSSTSCVSTSEDHHVHICSTTISTDTSLSTTEPKHSIHIITSGMYVCMYMS